MHRLFNEFKKQSPNHPGFGCITRLLDVIEDEKDRWLLYEIGGVCLTKELFDVKGEFFNGERIYQVNHQELYYKLKSDHELFKSFVTKLLNAFDLFQECGIVHADVKTDNILIEYDGTQIISLKFIDFGSAFNFFDTESLSLSTPEYLAPEILKYLSM